MILNFWGSLAFLIRSRIDYYKSHESPDARTVIDALAKDDNQGSVKLKVLQCSEYVR